MYDLYIKAPVTVDGKETKDVEYYGKDFNKITVTFEHEYEMIDEAKMGNENLTVKYFDKDGKEVTLAPEGTKVAYAEVSYGTVVTDPIVITTTKQAAAAVGQCELMDMYDQQFANYGITVAQILLTKTILENERINNVKNCFQRLLDMNVIPIFNENDTVAIDELELEIGENDSLSAIVASLVNADLLVILSDIDGLYSEDPRRCEHAKLIPVVEHIDAHIESIAGGAGTALGTGMATKINAAKIATAAGIDMVILNGSQPELLYDLFDGKPVGTRFLAKTN